LFPTFSPPLSPLTLSALSDYIRGFNIEHAQKAALHIWLSSPEAPRDLAVPLLLRFSIPDVLTAFITLDHAQGSVADKAAGEPVLMVENVTTFGSREKVRLDAPVISSSPSATYEHLTNRHRQKPPHSQSEYLVFQKLSQQIVRMIQSEPRVPFQTLMVRIAR